MFWERLACRVGGATVAVLLAFATGCAHNESAPAPKSEAAVDGPTQHVVVRTELGLLRGEERDGVVAFKGVRYGEDTGGESRFREPRPAPAWPGVRDALAFGDRCAQVSGSVNTSPRVKKLYKRTRPAPDPNMSEDCLFLNVWTPSPDARKRPVMVWIHGGAFSVGSGGARLYHGDRLARRGDVVVVTLNHRLGALGFLHADGATPNVGLLDIALALRFVREQIARFGGDPENVMVFGESGGAMKISAMMAMPDFDGLFHKAALQSGPIVRLPTPKQIAGLHDRFFAQAGTGSDVGKLRALSTEDLLEAQWQVTKPSGELEEPAAKDGGGRPTVELDFMPIVDGEVIPRQPFAPDATRPEVPMIIGTNLDEITFFLADDPRLALLTDGTLASMLSKVMGEDVSAVVAAYREARPDASARDLLFAATTDKVFRVPAIHIAERRVAAGQAKTWMYLFTEPSPAFDGALGATHGSEIGFVFHNLDAWSAMTGNDDARWELSGRVADAWLSFAWTGDPNHDGLPTWPAYDTKRRATMELDRTPRVVDDPADKEREAWSSWFAAQDGTPGAEPGAPQPEAVP